MKHIAVLARRSHVQVAHMTHVQVAHKSHSAQACWDPAAAAAARKTHLAAVHRMDVVQRVPREL